MSNVIWSWSELCRALGKSEGSGPDVSGISVDSRTLEPGDLFVALTGKPRPEFNILSDSGRDGHSFVDAALSRGASAVLVHEPVNPKARQMLVGDTFEALWQAACFRRDQLSCPVIAVTGSSGKTTFKELLNQLVKGFCSSGSFNNHIGVPISLMRTPAQSEYATYEIGTNHPGEIRKLTNLVRPTVAVCLNVHEAHIGNFKDHTALQREKLSIFDGLLDSGVAVVPENLRAATQEKLGTEQTVMCFGRGSGCDVQYEPLSESEVKLRSTQETVIAPIPGGGQHRAETLAAVTTVLLALGFPLSIVGRIGSDVPKGRGNTIQLGVTSLIDESYNANPSSMRAALIHLAKSPSRRKLAILGDMNELGSKSKSLHLALADTLRGIDGVVTVGQQIGVLDQVLQADQLLAQFIHADDQCLRWCQENIQAYDAVLVKGSNTVFWTNQFVDRLCAQFR